MAKKTMTVKFTGGDAPKPKVTPNGLIALRAPFPLTVKPGSVATVDFGFTCDTPLLVTSGPQLVLELNSNQFYAPGSRLSFLVHRNYIGPGSTDAVLDVGDTVLYAVPVSIPEFEIE